MLELSAKMMGAEVLFIILDKSFINRRKLEVPKQILVGLYVWL
jgi:hypothetical protein